MNEILKKHVYDLLYDSEKQYGFKIIFAGETGSRSYGLETENSDVDIKGFFLYSEDQYLSIKKLTSYLKLNHETKINKDIDVDLELIDLRKYLRDRCKNVILDESILWLQTENAYINLIPEELKNLLQSSIEAPLFQIWSKISKYQQKFIRCQQLEDGVIIVKDILNSIVQSFQVLYIKQKGSVNKMHLQFQKSYEEIQKIVEEQNSEELLAQVNKMYNLAQLLFELKKIDNKNKIHIDDDRLKEYFFYMNNFILKEVPIERNNFNHKEKSNQIFRQFLNGINLSQSINAQQEN